jgi:hypothetical protein
VGKEGGKDLGGRTASVDGGRGAVGNLLLDEVRLVLVVLQEGRPKEDRNMLSLSLNSNEARRAADLRRTSRVEPPWASRPSRTPASP